ncbi:protein-disulfide reductase DsbD domain-containing protein [Mesorhizobium sp. WSM2239]|uniref:Protein-disulfide reductase DsbD domain-containing protein n=2 Tax=unclassified Mesorhizobium TaxID=325217 RepID=A0AAU8D5E3_9HYPH
MRNIAIAFLALLLGANPPSALASSSDWFETQGGRLRLVTAGKPDEAGRLKGMLEIDLLPGWKTYWRDPGDAGVPPQIDVSANENIASAEFAFPAPERHNDGSFKWAGYDEPVALPIIFTLKSPANAALIEADVFLGVCETICIPAQTRLSLDPASDPDNPEEVAAVAAAFAALPAPAKPEFGVSATREEGSKLIVEAEFPGNPAAAEFFLAAAEGYAFGTPERVETDGKTLFSVEILARPDKVPAGDGLHYTLVTDAGAVGGLIPFM